MKFEKRADKKLKYQALCWLRLQQRCPFIATEVGGHSADVLGVNEKKMIEVEVKISLPDLLGDAKKYKHHYYNGTQYGTTHEQQWVPTHFYYALPAELVEPAKAMLEKNKFESYGIISMDEFTVVKRAKWLHKREPNSHVKFLIALRMGSELLRFHEAWV